MNTNATQDFDEKALSMKREYLQTLKSEEDDLNQKLRILQKAATDKTKVMNALHEYNDIKDAAQVVLGELACFHNVTVSEMHKKYNLLNSD